jgi:heat shock protein HtpX
LEPENKFFHYKKDSGLTFRIVICFFALSVLYIIFLTVLAYLGVGFLPMIAIISVMILAQWYFSDKIVLWSSGAKVVTKEQYPDLHRIVENLVQRSNLPKPKVAVVNTNIPNAFATGKGHTSSLVAVTTGLLDILDEEEIEGVIGHELSHIKNRDVLVLTMASLFSTIAWYLMQYGFYGSMYGGYSRSRGNSSGGGAIIIILLVSVITWIVSFIITRAISRYREFAADRGSAQITGKPMVLANALTKISESMKRTPRQQTKRFQSLNAFFIIPAISGSTIANLFATHPPLEQRIARLREMQSSLV